MKYEIRTLDSDPRYQGAHQKLADAQLKVRGIEQRISELNTVLARKVDLDAQARQYLETWQVPPVPIGPESPELENLHLERRIAMRALGVAKGDLDKVRNEISREINLECEPRNRELIQAIAVALRPLLEAANNYKEFRDEFGEKGISCALPVGTFPYLGFSLEPHAGMAGQWIKEMKIAGMIR